MYSNDKENIDFQGKVITFYSYKGGVGRSMSLVNIACLMAKQKKKVLLIDWDLEAPGLDTFFNKVVKKDDLGLVDFISDAIDNFKGVNDTEEHYERFLIDNMDKYILKDLDIDNNDLKLDFIKAGKFDDNYTAKLNAIDWISFYKNSPAFFRIFAQFLESKYDYILIDSRTGLSDTSGVCTMLMPQILILVFALNTQNIDGVIDVATQSLHYRFESNDYRDLRILPLPSRIDNDNPTELEIWIQRYKQKFQNIFQELYLLDDCKLENYFNIAKVPYKSIHAYGENIPVLKENHNNNLFISYYYAQFLKIIEDSIPIWDILSEEQLEINRKLANNHFQKGIEYYYAKEFENAIFEYQKANELIPTDGDIFNNWGASIYHLALLQKDEEKERLIEQSINKYKESLALNANNDIAYSNLGNALYQIGLSKEATLKEKYFKEAFDKYEKSIQLNPSNFLNFNRYGFALFKLAELKCGDEMISYLNASIDKYKKSLALKPDNVETFHCYGNVTYILATMKEDQEREELFVESEKLLLKGIELGDGNYNLSCLYALWFKKEKALDNLEKALTKKEVPIFHVEKDDDWINYINDSDFNTLLNKYKE